MWRFEFGVRFAKRITFYNCYNSRVHFDRVMTAGGYEQGAWIAVW